MWLAAAPWALGYHSTLMAASGATAALIWIAAAILVLAGTGIGRTALPWWVSAIVGLWAMATGLGVFGAVYPNEIVFGAIGAIVATFASQIEDNKKVAVHTKDGKTLVELSTMAFKNGRIEMRGKTFGTMPATMLVQPVYVWNLVGLLPLSLILRLPALLYVGWTEARSERRAAASS